MCEEFDDCAIFPIKKLKVNPNNPQKFNDLSKLENSIKEFPKMMELRPLVYDPETMFVLGGNKRLISLQKLGYTEIPRTWVKSANDFTEEEKKRFVIADNIGFGEWDWEILDEDYDLEHLKDWGLDEIDKSIVTEDLTDSYADEDYIPDIKDEPKTNIGDIYKLGSHRLMCGDSTDVNHVKLLNDNITPDVIVFDPPYDVESLYSEAMMPPIEGQKLIIMWDFKRFALAPSKALEFGWNPLYEFIWDNVQSWYTPNRPLARHKSIGVFGDDPYFNTDLAIIKDGKDRKPKKVSNTRGECNYEPLEGAKHISTVEQFPNTQQNDGHGHGKPIDWIKAIFSGVGGSVYFDVFGGSGATLIACESVGKTCNTMELDPRYCDAIIERWEKYTGNKAELINNE